MDPANSELIAVQARIRREAEQQQEVLGDLRNWMGTIAKKDAAIRAGTATIPAARKAAGATAVTTASAPAQGKEEKKKEAVVGEEKATPTAKRADSHVYDKGYSRWESFDVDAAMAEVDEGSTTGKGKIAQPSSSQPPSASIFNSSAPIRVRKAAVQVKAGDSGLASAEAEAARASGNAAYKAGDYRAASQHYTQALASAPSGSAIACLLLSNRAQCALQLKDYVSALEDASAALRADPTHVKSWLRRAAARNALGQPGAASRDLEVACALDKGNREAIVELRKAREASKACKKRALAEGAVSLPIIVVDDDEDEGDAQRESKEETGAEDLALAALKLMKSKQGQADKTEAEEEGNSSALLAAQLAPIATAAINITLKLPTPAPAPQAQSQQQKAAAKNPLTAEQPRESAPKQQRPLIQEETTATTTTAAASAGGKTKVAIIEDEEQEEGGAKAASPVKPAPASAEKPKKAETALAASAVASPASPAPAASANTIPAALATPARTSFEFERSWRLLAMPKNQPLQEASRAFFLLFTMLSPAPLSPLSPLSSSFSLTPLADKLASGAPIGSIATIVGVGWPRSLFRSYLEADVMMEMITTLSSAIVLRSSSISSSFEWMKALTFLAGKIPEGEADEGTKLRLRLEIGLRGLLVLQGLASVPRLSVTIAMLSTKDSAAVSLLLTACVETLSDAMAGELLGSGFFAAAAASPDGSGKGNEGGKEGLVTAGLKALGIAA